MSTLSPRPPRNERLDALIAELNELLEPCERRLTQRTADTQMPVVLIVGPPRSGTTLLTQWLASSNSFAVPTNLLARFSKTPALGARIQALLTDPRFAFGDELFDLAARTSGADFVNAIGKTRGALAPNEFAFFWRHFLRTQEITPLGTEGVARADWEGMRNAFASMEAVFYKPLALKGMFVQYDIEATAAELPHAFFLRIRRDPIANALALLSARERFYGDRAAWYSAKPAEFESLRTADPIEQVAGQVIYTERVIDKALANLHGGRSLEIGYEAFCANPHASWIALRQALGVLDRFPVDIGPGETLPERFEETSSSRNASPDAAAVAAAIKQLS